MSSQTGTNILLSVVAVAVLASLGYFFLYESPASEINEDTMMGDEMMEESSAMMESDEMMMEESSAMMESDDTSSDDSIEASVGADINL